MSVVMFELIVSQRDNIKNVNCAAAMSFLTIAASVLELFKVIVLNIRNYREHVVQQPLSGYVVMSTAPPEPCLL